MACEGGEIAEVPGTFHVGHPVGLLPIQRSYERRVPVESVVNRIWGRQRHDIRDCQDIDALEFAMQPPNQHMTRVYEIPVPVEVVVGALDPLNVLDRAADPDTTVWPPWVVPRPTRARPGVGPSPEHERDCSQDGERPARTW